jgi:hypothetical protein
MTSSEMENIYTNDFFCFVYWNWFSDAEAKKMFKMKTFLVPTLCPGGNPTAFQFSPTTPASYVVG